MWMRVDGRRPFMVLLVALIAMTWLALSIWSLSPFAPYLSHEVLDHLPLTISVEYATLLFVFVAGWTLMTVAMMLPTSLPLVALFRQMTRRRPDGLRLIALLILGYLAVWTLFGGLAHFGDLFVHAATHRFAWLDANEWAIGAAVFALAGLYQFTPLKYACLEKCRSPLSFITEHWRGRHEHRQAFRLGVRHGLFCVGCCWSLMLLMFAVACGNIAWMLALGAVMGVEKNLPWGRRIGRPLGLLLLGSSLLLTLSASLDIT